MINHQGLALGSTSARLDVRPLMRRYLAAFKGAEPWQDTIERLDRCRWATQRSTNGRLTALAPWRTPKEKIQAVEAALDVRDAVEGHLDTIAEAADAFDKATAPAPEEIIRAILAMMLSVLRSKPTEGAEFYITALVWELMEPDTGRPLCAPAIAASAKEIWTTKTFAPSIPEFVTCAKKHQELIEASQSQLRWILRSHAAATEVLEKLEPGMLEDDWATDDEPIAPRPPGWRAPEFPADNSDVPF